MNDFEKMYPLLHEFFCAGGQVYWSSARGYEVIYPVYWNYSQDASDKVRSSAGEILSGVEVIPSLTLNEAAEQLRLSYRQAAELIKMAELGGIRKSGVYKIYPPSITTYLERLSNGTRKRRWYDAKLNG